MSENTERLTPQQIPVGSSPEIPTKRSPLLIVLIAVLAAVITATLGTWILTRGTTATTAVPVATTTSAVPSPTIDSAGHAACTSIHYKAAPDADGTTPTTEDWQYWAKDVASTGDLAAQSTNRSIRRAGEDLQETLSGDTFVPAFVEDAATALRIACDREDYINLYGPDR